VTEEFFLGTYFQPQWCQEFDTLTDISILGYMTYLGYPFG
jgi:hypothetical protein